MKKVFGFVLMGAGILAFVCYPPFGFLIGVIMVFMGERVASSKHDN